MDTKVEDQEQTIPIVGEKPVYEIKHNDKGEKVINEMITVKEQIGDGAFSKVYRIEYRFIWEEDGKQMDETFPYAMKVMNEDQLMKKNIFLAHGKAASMMDFVQNEINILKRIRHENIIKLFEILRDDNKIYLITELCNKGSVLKWNPEENKYVLTSGFKTLIEENPHYFELEQIDWNKLDEREVLGKFLFRQLFKAVEFLHEQNIIHRDIKWENILCKYNEETQKIELKLIDFSIAKQLSPDELLTEFVGTTEYQPPEVVNGKFEGKPCDIWALGCCLYSFFFGKLPGINGVDPEDFKESAISDDLKDLLTSMLDPDPTKRITIEEILIHLWML